MPMRPLPLLCLAACVLGLQGCGQKGPLYLPDATGEVVTRPASSETEEERQPQAPKP
jgi:predicted small lipoprotein YifL